MATSASALAVNDNDHAAAAAYLMRHAGVPGPECMVDAGSVWVPG